jgi:Protein of unknown function (DUF3631)
MTIKTNSILSSQTLDEWRGSVTTFNGFTDTRPDQEYSNSNWQGLKNKIAPEIPLLITDKKRGEYFIPCLLKEAPLIGGTLEMAIKSESSTIGKMRSKNHATETRFLTVDIDGLPENEFETITDRLKAENISSLTYSTFSHGNPAKPGVRVRLIIPVDTAINFEDYPSAWQAFNTRYLAGSGDASGSKLYQQQGTWSCEPSRQAQAFKMSNDAGVVSVVSLMAIDGEITVKEPAGSQNHDETYPSSDANMVADKCAQIGQFREYKGSAQTEPDWVNCLGVVGHCENGEAVAQAWSSGHEGYNESATDKKLTYRLRYGPTTCNQFRRTNPDGCGGCMQTCNSPITLGRQDSQPILDNLAIEKPELEKTETASPKSIFEEVIPYHEPVDPPALLDEIKTTLISSIILDDEEADAVTLWIVLTYFIDYVQILALLLINGPEFSCGKTQLLGLIGRMSAKGFPMVNISLAAVFRVIDLYRPTLLFDEADQFFRSNKDIAGLINAGHSPTSASVIRLVGEDHTPKSFSVWCPKVVAGIAIQKHLPSATMSRGIVINMRRKMKHEKVKRIRHADLNGCDILQSKLARFALDCGEKISLSRPDMPDELSDRQQDNWEPLFAIAECVSSEWVVRANAAALKLSANAEPSASINNELLGDIQQVFEIKKIDKISTVNLIEELVKNDEAPWSGFNRGKPITPRQLAKTLDTYGIKSKTVRTQFGTPKGYTWDQFRDVFDRYLSPSESDLHTEKMPQLRNDSLEGMPIMGSDVAAKTQLETQRNADENVAADVSRNSTLAATPEPLQNMTCGGVADVAINIEPEEEAF